MKRIFISGGTGYIGQSVIPNLLQRGHHITALARPGSEGKLPTGAHVITGNALKPFDCTPACAFVHLVGTPHPAPWKGKQFRAVDLPALKASVESATRAQIPHFVFLSVAQPAPVMRAFIEVRAECERILRDSGLAATILRPWYVLGPGHRWPLVLQPFYHLAERSESLRESATRLGLVTIEQMVETLTWAVENPPTNIRILGVPEIRNGGIPSAARV